MQNPIDKTVITVYNEHIQLTRGNRMHVFIDNKSGTPIYDQIYTQIKAQIINGSLGEDEMLPSIRGLAKDLRISFITTKRAYEELEKDGFIYTVPGKGCFVAAKNLELLRELYLKQIEEYMDQVVRLADACNLTKKDITDMVAFAWEERK